MKVEACVRCKIWIVDGINLEEKEKTALATLSERGIVKPIFYNMVCCRCQSNLGQAVSNTLLKLLA